MLSSPHRDTSVRDHMLAYTGSHRSGSHRSGSHRSRSSRSRSPIRRSHQRERHPQELEELFGALGFRVSPFDTIFKSMSDALPPDALPVYAEPVDTEPVDAEPIDTKPFDSMPFDTEPFDPTFGDSRFEAWLFEALHSNDSHSAPLVAMPSDPAEYMANIKRVQWDDAEWEINIKSIMGVPDIIEWPCESAKCMGVSDPSHSRAYEYCGGLYVCNVTAHGLEPCDWHHAKYPVGDPYRGALASGHPLDHERADLARRGNPFDGCAFCTCLVLDTKRIMDARAHALGLMRAQKKSARLEWRATSRPDQPIAFKCID